MATQTDKKTDKTEHTALDQVRTPLLAAIGAGEMTVKALVDALGKARERAESAGELRDRLDPAELRKLVDEYTDSAVKLYQKLAEHGEDAVGKLRNQPQVKRAIEQLEEAVATTQSRVGDVAGDARGLAEDVLRRVTRQTRSIGEKTARATEKAAGELAEAVEEAGDDAAHQVRSTTRRAANKTAPARKPSGGTQKTTSGQ